MDNMQLNDSGLMAKPGKLTAIAIGAGAMTIIGIIPGLNLINCLCCAGIMGGAILGVWFYKNSFPDELPFTVGDGVTIGALAGLLAGVVTSIGHALIQGIFSKNFQENVLDQIDVAFEQAQTGSADAAQIEQVREIIMQLVGNPLALFAFILIASVLLYTGFGALGGVIGGNIFKTKIVEEEMPGGEN